MCSDSVLEHDAISEFGWDVLQVSCSRWASTGRGGRGELQAFFAPASCELKGYENHFPKQKGHSKFFFNPQVDGKWKKNLNNPE